jgi:modulator of FtsH protease HflC
MSPASLRLALVAALTGLVIAGLVTTLSALFIVDQSEQAIIVEFGEPKGGVISRPGLHWKKPFIQEVRRFDRRLLIWDGDPNQIPTLGREFISVDAVARWLIVDPLQFLKSVRDEAGARSRLNDIIDSVVRDKVSNTDLEEIVRSKDWNPTPTGAAEEAEVLGTDDALKKAPKKGREQLTREIIADAQRGVAALGIKLVDVRIKRLNYIDEVRSKVEERMISERQRVAEHFRSQGAGRSAEIDGETEREQQRIASEGRRRAEEIRGRADAEATKIYAAAYGKDAEFFAFFRTLESYGKAIDANTTMMVRADSEFYKYMQDISPRR